MTVPHTRRPAPRWAVATVLVAAVALALGGCGDDGGDEATDAGSSTTAAETTTTEATTSTEATSTTEGSEPSTTDGGATTTTPTTVGLAPGDACSLEEGVADCIDPDGDGEGTYLIGGDACMATAPDPLACEDSDGDGVAGPTDEYADLPTCGADVPPPCNNPPGSGEDAGTDDGTTTTTSTEPAEG